jgi:hypothetical protein
MKSKAIIMTASEDERESLAVALRTLAAVENVELAYDDICAALGVSFTAVATRLERTPGWWTTYGRDLFVEQAAALFGISLRNLHPPAVGLELSSSDAYAQHFQASYAPLIRRAIENGQIVLAWQGWPNTSWAFWGLITGMDEGGFGGTTIGAGPQQVRLNGPALQCYTVERCEPFQPRQGDLFEMAVHHANIYMNQGPLCPVGPQPPVIVTGPMAIDWWGKWLDSGEVSPGDWSEHWHYATCVAAARHSANRFLRSCWDAVEGERRALLTEAREYCSAMVTRIAESCNPAVVQEKFKTPAGRRELGESILLAEADDRRLALAIERLSGG